MEMYDKILNMCNMQNGILKKKRTVEQDDLDNTARAWPNRSSHTACKCNEKS